MSYEVAQQILGQLATSTEIFTFSYVGINFVVYAWKRSLSESNFSTTNQPLLSQAPIAEPLDLPQKTLKMPEPMTNSLKKQDSFDSLMFPNE